MDRGPGILISSARDRYQEHNLCTTILKHDDAVNRRRLVNEKHVMVASTNGLQYINSRSKSITRP